jgi:Helix-turn-helix domain of resolvase/Resolvase, N terminal domain
VQNAAKATYRDILERRARENHVDFVDCVATAITPIAFFETVMVKSYESLVDSNTTVDVNTGMVAAVRLQSLIDSKDDSIEIAEMRVKVAKISEAVRAVVPESMWGELTIMAAFAQLERDTMIERTRAGLAAAAANGRKGGRPRKVDDAAATKARTLREKGINAADIAKMLGVSRATVYRYLSSDGVRLSAD